MVANCVTTNALFNIFTQETFVTATGQTVPVHVQQLVKLS